MSEVRRGKGLYSALAYLPVVVPPVVAVLLWKFFYDADPNGVFNTILGWVGIPPQPWLQSTGRRRCRRSCSRRPGPRPAARSSSTSPRCLSVPPELYDAAEVDGAGIWRKVWHVTMPQLRGILFIMLILQVIATAQVFLEPFLFTGGGPAGATLTILLYIYDYAFRNSPGRRLRRGDRGVACCSRSCSASCRWLYFKLTDRWSTS